MAEVGEEADLEEYEMTINVGEIENYPAEKRYASGPASSHEEVLKRMKAAGGDVRTDPTFPQPTYSTSRSSAPPPPPPPRDQSGYSSYTARRPKADTPREKVKLRSLAGALENPTDLPFSTMMGLVLKGSQDPAAVTNHLVKKADEELDRLHRLMQGPAVNELEEYEGTVQEMETFDLCAMEEECEELVVNPMTLGAG